ncbi:potassium voltage-gated channel protein Shaw-like [Lingula anatina]|uniref:Potassium voltage-gated channel protein Shaw-like n=1 Tax=Lingula anatina TaxID=7574 RepID=A0A1S3HNF8_LINAN|nr:potassium voltage-gated channel protein Shaw-like [Lingula anatina]XP_013387573.1 potassium voltage-gated channel protein Shaw-like [Lingula anatina]XP_013387574.1 potassium voltage-gated channel protein Shaw-like [Lingula anatina]XP_013387575.1 potassium voltage-gated channel protein Shaw-like [Lingula anatina]|eukprot:XP_013387572.1 potassium voltage-gated channel protein Shaw-like [Lingula anatina]
MSLKVTGTPDGEAGVYGGTVRLNVGGSIHEVSLHTLQNKATGLLADKEELMRYYRPAKEDYFFDRHPGIFCAILNFYRTGELHVPLDTCGPAMKNELEFWGIDENEVVECCWVNYSNFQEQKASLAKFDSFLGKDMEVQENRKASKWETTRRKVWNYLDNPSSSLGAKVYLSVSLFFVIVSILVFAMDTHEAFRIKPGDPEWENLLSIFHVDDQTYQEIMYEYNDLANKTSAANANESYSLLHPAMEIINVICACFFTFELVMRFIFCPRKCRFFLEPLTIIDLIAVVPFYIELIMNISNPKELFTHSVLDFIHILQIARVFRIFRLAKSYVGMKVILYSLKESLAEIALTLVILCISMLIFSSLMFFADNINNPACQYPDIPTTLWWSIITLTTVGYGDFYPTSGPGYVVGAIAAFCGVLLLALTIPIIVSNFFLYYSHSRVRPKKHKKDKLEECDSRHGSVETLSRQTPQNNNGQRPSITKVTPCES